MSPAPDSTLADPQQIIADLRRKLAQCRTERDEALAQQTATAEVLGVISSSPRAAPAVTTRGGGDRINRHTGKGPFNT